MPLQSNPPVQELVSCRVIKAESINSNTVRFWVTPMEAHREELHVDWEPGSHVDVHADGGIIRQYSLLPTNDKSYSFAIKISNSPSQERIRNALQVGNILNIGLPRSILNLDKQAMNHHFVAAGIGITPFVSMLTYAAGHLPGHVSLTYIARREEDFLFTSQLGKLFQDTRNTFHKVTTSISGRPRMQDIFSSASPEDAFYFCGPTALIREATAYAQKSGFHRVYAEYFEKVQAPGKSQEQKKEVQLKFSRSGITISMDENSTILAGIREAGIEITTSCERGVCGACETEIVSGQAHHLDQIMGDEEKSCNEFVFPCVSKVANEYLEIDL